MASKVMVPCLLLAMFLIGQPAAACSSCGTEAKLSFGQCPVRACANLLEGLMHPGAGQPSGWSHCCPLVQGLADLEAADCLCSAANAEVWGSRGGLAYKLNLLANACGRKVPEGYNCLQTAFLHPIL